MNAANENALEFMVSELNKALIEVSQKESGREGVDFLIGTNEIYLQSINLDTAQRSIKISKQDLGELKNNLFIALVLIIDKTPRVLYIIPSKQLLQSDSNTFINNEVSLMPSLSNWEIKISTNSLHKLENYTISNQIEKLNS
tara:strand:- start:1457 stop:1882 length:426 start_codon:yes stop_codon:yes gene_type:complete